MLGAQKVGIFAVLSSEKGRLFWCRPLSPRVYWRFLGYAWSSLHETCRNRIGAHRDFISKWNTVLPCLDGTE